MPLSETDYALSMKISKRGRREEVEPDSLRSLLVHRLTDTFKAVFRVSLRTGNRSVLCEGCGQWSRADGYPETFTCPYCDRAYRIEFAVYEEISTDVGDPS